MDAVLTSNGQAVKGTNGPRAPVPGRELGVADLLAPLTPGDFLARYWDQTLLHIPRNQSKHYAGLFSVADLEEVISSQDFNLDDLRLIRKSSKPITPVRPILSDEGIAQPGAFYAEYFRGATINLRKVHLRRPPVTRMCRRLEELFTAASRCGAFFTPAHAQGALPHFTGGHVFMLHLEGCKRWQLWKPIIPFALKRHRGDVSELDLGPPDFELTLHPGDLLYCPPGYIHEAWTEDSAALHLSVVIEASRWTDMLADALDAVSDRDERYRHSLPPGLLLERQPASDARERFKGLLRDFAEQGNFEEALDRLADRFLSGLRPLPDGHLGRLAQVDALELDSVVRKRDGMPCRVDTAQGMASIQFPGSTVRGPLSLEPALRFIAEAGTFPIRALPALGDESKLILVHRLLREGLLRPAEELLP